MRNATRGRRRRPGGFTLTEMLIVILIILLISVAALPAVWNTYQSSGVNQAARLLQATLARARDEAIRNNAPRGIRLIPDPEFPGPPSPLLASTRIIAIEPATDYTEGRVSVYGLNPTDPVSGNPWYAAGSWGSFGSIPSLINPRLTIYEEKYTIVQPSGSPVSIPIPNSPTSWYWNIRLGDKIRFGDSGRYYTIVGPMVIRPTSENPALNSELYVNMGLPNPNTNPFHPGPTGLPEFLWLANGQDDDGDGFVDEGSDGLDNDGDGVIDPGYDGIDNDGQNGVDDPGEMYYPGNAVAPGMEYEPEQFTGPQFNTLFFNKGYTIIRRPRPSEGVAETVLPAGVVIDMTGWNSATVERSRLPVDLVTHYVDILIAPNGTVTASNYTGNVALMGSQTPFYHFWLANREDALLGPLWGDTLGVPNPNPNTSNGLFYVLPMPADTPGYPAGIPALKGERRLVSLNIRTGEVIANTIELGATASGIPTGFNVNNINQPYLAAQAGAREEP